MRKAAQQFTSSDARQDSENGASIAVNHLSRLAEDWLADCQIRQHSSVQSNSVACFSVACNGFCRSETTLNAVALSCGFSSPIFPVDTPMSLVAGAKGRGCSGSALCDRRWMGRTFATYARSSLIWSVSSSSRLLRWRVRTRRRCARIRLRLTKPQIEALLQATQRSKYARRDEAVVRFLLDTGVRVSELCELKCGTSVSLRDRRAFWAKGTSTARPALAYLRDDTRMPDEPVFLSERVMAPALNSPAGAQVRLSSSWALRQVFR